MDEKKSKSKKINKKNELLIVVLSFSLSFTVLFFSPAEMYIRNQDEYLIGALEILMPMFVASLVISAVNVLLLNLMLIIHEKLYVAVSRLMAGLLFAFYMQEMFMNGKMTVITGDSLEIDNMTWSVLLNLLIFYLMVVLPLLLYYCRERFPKMRLFHAGNGYVLPYFVGLVFVMQLFGLIGSVVEFGVDRYEGFYNKYLSYEPTMSLSREKNIVVFLADRLDSFYMDEILETYPDMHDELKDFTFYQNNLSHYTNTFPSIVNMLTGLPYENEKSRNYFKKAWNRECFLDTLKENDFHINLFLSRISEYDNYEDLESKCDNIKFYDGTAYSFNYLGKNGIVPTMTRLSLGKMMPYSFKAVFIAGIWSDFSEKFISYDEIADLMPRIAGVNADLKYYDYLTTVGLSNDNNRKTFSFICLVGTHYISKELSNLYSGKHEKGSFGTLSEVRGDFEIIFTYIRQMKELGIYDNSTIIILGDHGRFPIEVDNKGNNQLESPIVTALLIKPEGNVSEAFKVDGSVELSNDYLGASVLECAGIEHDKFGYSYNDIINNNLHPERYFDIVLEEEFISSYKVTGNARDFNNWVIVK